MPGNEVKMATTIARSGYLACVNLADWLDIGSAPVVLELDKKAHSGIGTSSFDRSDS